MTCLVTGIMPTLRFDSIFSSLVMDNKSNYEATTVSMTIAVCITLPRRVGNDLFLKRYIGYWLLVLNH